MRSRCLTVLAVLCALVLSTAALASAEPPSSAASSAAPAAASPAPAPPSAPSGPSSPAVAPLTPAFQWMISACCQLRLNNCADLCYPCDPHLSCTDLQSGGCSSTCTCARLGCPIGGGL
jgi:hypothetical protein